VIHRFNVWLGPVFDLLRQPEAELRAADGLPADAVRRDPENPQHKFTLNPFARLAVFAVLFILTFLFVNTIYMAVTGSATMPEIVFTTLAALCALGSYLLFTCLMEGRVWPIELAARRWVGVLLGIAAGVVLITVIVGIIALFGAYRIRGLNPAHSFWLDFINMGIAAALVEEILLRGVLARVLEDAVGSWISIGIVTVAVVLLQLRVSTSPVALLAVAAGSGVLLTAVYFVTRSLWWVMGLHLAWNMTENLWGSVMSASLSANSGLPATSWPGPAWLTGGAVGVEASIVAFFLFGGASAWILVQAQRHGLIVAPSWKRGERPVSAGHAA
jgi:membrane protease YdiL (CAAX protease family)